MCVLCLYGHRVPTSTLHRTISPSKKAEVSLKLASLIKLKLAYHRNNYRLDHLFGSSLFLIYDLLSCSSMFFFIYFTYLLCVTVFSHLFYGAHAIHFTALAHLLYSIYFTYLLCSSTLYYTWGSILHSVTMSGYNQGSVTMDVGYRVGLKWGLRLGLGLV